MGIDHHKDPDATLDYVFDWSDWLAGDTITSHAVTAVGVTAGQTVLDGDRVIAWISGGIVGQDASATCRITTAAGRVDDRTIHFTIVSR